MTSWPWMKGVEVAIADPIPPVCPEDERKSVKDLIKEHAEKIAKIKAALVDHPLYDETKHDDLWILRFWLSHSKSKAAIEAAKHTLEFRKQHNLDDKDIRDTPPHKVKDGKIREFLNCWKEDAMVFTHPDEKRGVIAFLKMTSMDQHAVVENTTMEHTEAAFIWGSEWSFQWLDYVTRTTGRLTRSVRFVDMDGFAMDGFSRECSKRDTKVMGAMEDCYPQMLESIFVVNPPKFVDILWVIFRAISPKRVIEKFDVIHPKENPKQRQHLFKHISEDNLPEHYGGNNPKDPQDW